MGCRAKRRAEGSRDRVPVHYLGLPMAPSARAARMRPTPPRRLDQPELAIPLAEAERWDELLDYLRTVEGQAEDDDHVENPNRQNVPVRSILNRLSLDPRSRIFTRGPTGHEGATQ